MFAASLVATVTTLTDRRADLRGAGVGVCGFLSQDLRAFLQTLGQISERVVGVSRVDYGRRRRTGSLAEGKKMSEASVNLLKQLSLSCSFCLFVRADQRSTGSLITDLLICFRTLRRQISQTHTSVSFCLSGLSKA